MIDAVQAIRLVCWPGLNYAVTPREVACSRMPGVCLQGPAKAAVSVALKQGINACKASLFPSGGGVSGNTGTHG